ncbi:thiamine-phosphate diphosphorylase [Rhodovulum imhoffii]|uniref:Thiamine-phosphate synthase n=1 Tax=Rhodovulum imhoffii TaxID=365340 RepID=A0A2T5BNW5_9RHOB|nr:thiamine phosphate synthase [Rhodovulum imhoffii]MBK5932546.1 thiamine-phosphate diphosphorylase [Rhodovulum imhoffii]PTN00687.1 thiamine-phosphate diphosphorylase [Rhodovulum imhoffii]
MIGVYFITDPDAPQPVADQALAAARGGARLIQLRDKHASDQDMAAQARALMPALEKLGAKLVINDRVEVACVVKAHGLHVGQGDGDPREIRRRIGPDMLLGLSVDCKAQLCRIPRATVSYLGVGPVRATATKPDHAPPLGFERLERVVAAAGYPCVAIGGLGQGDAAAVRSAGAVGICFVSAISRSSDPEAATRVLCAEWSA